MQSPQKNENSNLPLYLFHQGTNYRAYEYMGMHKTEKDGRIRYILTTPEGETRSYPD